MSFVSPGMLIFISAVGIPIIIHLMKNQKFINAHLGTNRFLIEVLKTRNRWRKIENLLLFLLRVAIILLLVALFMRPFIQQPKKVTGSMVVVLFDTSGSEYDDFYKLKQNYSKRLGQISKQLPKEAEIKLFSFNNKITPIDKSDIMNLTCTGEHTDYKAVFNETADFIKLAKKDSASVILFSDLQTNGISELDEFSFPADIPVIIESSNKLLSQNLTISKIRNLTPVISSKKGQKLFNIELEARLNIYGSEQPETVQIGYNIDGKYNSQKVRVENGRCIIDAKISEETLAKRYVSGFFHLESDDDLKVDNYHQFILPIEKTGSILIHNGQVGVDRFEDSSYFIEKSLNSFKRRSQQKWQTKTVAKLPAEIEEDLLILCQPQNFSEIELAAMDEYMNAGGKVIIFAGEEFTIADESFKTQLPFKVEKSPVNSPTTIKTWDKKYVGLKLFDGTASGDLSSLFVFDTLKIEEKEGVKKLVELSNGSTLIAETAVGKGSLLFIAQSCEKTGAQFVTQRMFIPLLHELVNYKLSNDKPQLKVYHNDLIDLEKVRLVEEPTFNEKELTYTATVKNFNEIESDIERLTPEEFYTKLGLSKTDLESRKNEMELMVKPKNTLRPNEIWIWVIAALALVWVIENMVADRRVI